LKANNGMPALWRNRDYMLLWSGQVVATLGSTMSMVVFPLLILYLTDSPAAAGIAGALFTIPYVVFSLPAGALVDRWNRKRVMIVADAVRAAAFASIPVAMFFDSLNLWHLYLVAIIEGTFFVFFNIAEVAALPRVVPKEQLPDATAQNMATFSIAGLIGPALGAVLYQGVGKAVPFLVNAATFTVSVISLTFVRTDFQAERSTESRNLLREIKEGLGWLWRNPLLRFMAFVTGGINLAFSGVVLVVIVMAKDLGADDAAVGIIFSIGAIGGIIGAALAGKIQRRFGYGQVTIACMWLIALALPLNVFAPAVWVLGLIWALWEITIPVYSVVQISYRLPLIPDQLQGRVNSSFRLLAFGFQPLGATLAGVLLQVIGAVPTVLIFSVWLFLLAVAVTLNPQVRQALHSVEPETPGEINEVEEQVA
jgi:MFS family permease